MSKRHRRPRPTDVDRGPEFKFIEFNPIRCGRGAEAARVAVNGQWLWMSERDIDRNMETFGRDPELIKAKMSYGIAPPPAFVQTQTLCVPPEPENDAPAVEQNVGPWAAELARREYLHEIEEQRADAVRRARPESEADQ